jgi:hypothetical protein
MEGRAFVVTKKTSKTKGPPPTSRSLDSIVEELRHGGDRAEIASTCASIAEHLRTLGLPDHYWDFIEIGRGQKKNFAQRFSNSLAQKVADALRSRFPGILPDEHGKGHESRSRAAGGAKKLDVNYSTKDMGLGLAVSVKTINFRDEKNKRFTKNIKRADGELRAEAQDCHTRQPYAVLVGIILLPLEAATDGVGSGSSLHHAWDVFSRRGGRSSTEGDQSRFERVFIGLYESAGTRAGTVAFFDVEVEPPPRGAPTETMTFSVVIKAAERAFQDRNRR